MKKRTTSAFTHPQIIETTVPSDMTYVVDSRLLETFGLMKLDTAPLSSYDGGSTMNPANFNQCGYGSWSSTDQAFVQAHA